MAIRKETKLRSKRRLGRGLESLISAPVKVDAPDATGTAVAEPPSGAPPDSPAGGPGLRMIALASIRPSRSQPRRHFDEASLEALAASIRANGMMQPVVLRPQADGGGFELVAGERRWRAAGLLGLEQIPAVVHEIDDPTSARWSLVENIQREDLNPIERAEAFEKLADGFGMTHQEIADQVGIDRSSVTNHLRLNDLDPTSKDAVRAGRLTLGHAKALLAVTDARARAALAALAIKQGLTVRQLERRIRGNAGGGARGGRRQQVSSNLRDLERRLGEHLGTKVAIQTGRTKGSGKLVVDFFSLEQFDGLLSRLGFDAADQPS